MATPNYKCESISPIEISVSTLPETSPAHRLLQRLTSYEFNHLLEALRRDMRSEESLSHDDPEWTAHHRRNARKSHDLLEMLNPKHAHI